MSFDIKEARATLASSENQKSKTPERHRSFLSELYVSLVWIYSKLINPLLIGVIALSVWLTYYIVADMSGSRIFVVLALLVLIINCVVVLFSSSGNGESDGVELDRSQAPVIWDAIDKISTHASCRPITRLVIDGDLNAYAAERKTKGLFKKPELEIGIGLPLMAALEPAEVSSVIAHEIGHHNGDDARRITSVVKAFERSSQIIDLADDFGFLFLPVTWLLKSYRYGLALLSQKLRHQAEFEADSFAAKVCGVEATGKSDVALAVFAEDLTKVIHKPISDALKEGGSLPDDLFENLPSRFRAALDSTTFQTKLSDALAEKTDFWCSHPSVGDRLKNIGATPTLPAFDADRVAAKAWLGGHYQHIAEAIQQKWVEQFSDFEPMMEQHRKYLAYNRASLAAANQQLLKDPMDADALLLKAQAVSNLFESDEAIPELKETLNNQVYNPEIELLLANLEINAGNSVGLSRLFELIEKRAEFHTVPAIRRLEELVDWAKDAAKDKNSDFHTLIKTLREPEIRSAVKKLAKPARTIFAEQIAHNQGQVIVPTFPEWKTEVLQAWFAANPEISRAWIFQYAEDADKKLPAYCVLLSFDTEDKEENFGGFEEADLPLRGVHETSMHVGFGTPGAIFAKLHLPPAVGPILADTPPFYTQRTQSAGQPVQMAA